MAVPVEDIQACSLFSSFSEAGLAMFAHIGKSRTLPQGMSLFLVGSRSDSMFVVVEGELVVSSRRDLHDEELCNLGAGESLGELALLRAGRRSVSVRAAKPSRLVEFLRSDFQSLLTQKPQACMKLMLAINGEFEARVREHVGVG